MEPPRDKNPSEPGAESQSKPNDLARSTALVGHGDREPSESVAASPAQGETEMFTELTAPVKDRPVSKETVSSSLGSTTEFTGDQPTLPATVRAAYPAKSAAAKPQATQAMAATGEFAEAGARAEPERPQAPAAKSAAKPATPRPSENEETPQTIGDFRLDKKLGEGGMGAVYRAHQISMDRTVALKLLAKNLNDNQTFVDRFVREARTMARLDHPNIVRGYAVDCVDGQHLVAMEFVDGASMQKWMNKLGKLSIGDAVHVVLCTAYALEHAHEQTLVHRDIKPDNILMTNKGVVKLADLGLAKASDDNLSLTQSGTGFGTPFYMPLEQYRDAKRVDARADIYALGVTLYYFLTGKLPFTGDTHFDVIKLKEAAKFTPARRHNPEVPERLDLMIDKMIQKDAAHRYQTCAQVIEALQSIGVASEFPSFIGASARNKTGPSSTARPSTLPPKTKPSTAPPAGADDPGRELWVLRTKDENGRKAKKQVSTGRLKQLLERGEIDPATATIHRINEQNQRLIGSVPEFSSLVQSKMVQVRADRRSQRLENVYEKLERSERRRRIFRALDNFFRGLAGWIVILVILAGLVIGGWWLFKNKDTVVKKAQDAVKSVQDSTGLAGQKEQPKP